MRQMSFALTTPQVRRREKTVTRRLGWRHARAGDVVQPVIKGQGLKKGEHVELINGPVRLIAVRREPLWDMTPDDCAREGFPALTPDQFIAMFCKHNGCLPGVEVARIEFEYLETV